MVHVNPVFSGGFGCGWAAGTAAHHAGTLNFIIFYLSSIPSPLLDSYPGNSRNKIQPYRSKEYGKRRKKKLPLLFLGSGFVF